jgi:ubiquinone/menaquinone biosynthesis C-methylase UbiE
MESDWDNRAKVNARRWIARDAWHNEDEFDKSGALGAQELLDGLSTRRDAVVLEIGVGIGRITKYLAMSFDEVHGVDVSGEMIRRARERLKGFPNVSVTKNNGIDLSMFAEKQFDYVFSVRVLYHVPRAVFERYVSESHRVLKPGGIMRFQIFEKARAAGIVPWLWIRNLRHLHLRFWADPPDRETWSPRCYSRDELNLILRNNGFTVTDTKKGTALGGDLWITATAT